MVLYQHCQTISGRAITSNSNVHFYSIFIETQKKEKNPSLRIEPVSSIQKRTRFRYAILAWLDRNESVLFAYATSSGPKWMQNLSKVKVRDIEENVPCLQKQERNYKKCFSLVKELGQVYGVLPTDEKKFRTEISVRLNGLPRPCWCVISPYVPEDSIL